MGNANGQEWCFFSSLPIRSTAKTVPLSGRMAGAGCGGIVDAGGIAHKTYGFGVRPLQQNK